MNLMKNFLWGGIINKNIFIYKNNKLRKKTTIGRLFMKKYIYKKRFFG